VVGERARPLEHPDIVLRIDRHAADLTEDPVMRQRLRPVRIDAERGGLRVGGEARKQSCQKRDNQCRPSAFHKRVLLPHALSAHQWISGSAIGAVPPRKSKSQPSSAWPICCEYIAP